MTRPIRQGARVLLSPSSYTQVQQSFEVPKRRYTRIIQHLFPFTLKDCSSRVWRSHLAFSIAVYTLLPSTAVGAMSVPTEGARRTRRRRHPGARTAVFFLWVILIFAQLDLFFAFHDQTGRPISSTARKARFFNGATRFHVVSSPAQFAGTVGDSNTLYGEDKRLIHTGPNPLHN